MASLVSLLLKGRVALRWGYDWGRNNSRHCSRTIVILDSGLTRLATVCLNSCKQTFLLGAVSYQLHQLATIFIHTSHVVAVLLGNNKPLLPFCQQSLTFSGFLLRFLCRLGPLYPGQATLQLLIQGVLHTIAGILPVSLCWKGFLGWR